METAGVSGGVLAAIAAGRAHNLASSELVVRLVIAAWVYFALQPRRRRACLRDDS